MTTTLDEAKKLESLLDNPADVSIDQLPVPTGVSKKVEAAIKNPAVDNKIYKYKDLADWIKSMPETPKIPSGFKDIDVLVDGGWEGGEVVVLSAPEKSGKTTFAQTLMINQAFSKIPVLFFTLEMGWKPITKKFMKMDWEFLTMEAPSDVPIYYPIDTRAVSIDWVRSQVMFAKKNLGVKMVYIDHLHDLFSLSDTSSKINVSLFLGDIIKKLQDIAEEADVTIFLIAHMTKTDPHIMPDKNSIRDSSFITQGSDFTLLLWREAEKRGKNEDVLADSNIYTGRTILSMELNRRTGMAKRMAFGMYENQFYPFAEAEALKSSNQNNNSPKVEERLTEVKTEIEKNNSQATLL